VKTLKRKWRAGVNQDIGNKETVVMAQKRLRSVVSLSSILAFALATAQAPAQPSPSPTQNKAMPALKSNDADHLYLEEVLGERALTEVRGWNDRSLKRLTSDPRFAKMEADVLAIVNSKDKIPYVSYRKGVVQNFWQDEKHVRGLWRRSTLDSYLSNKTEWETVLDIDALAKAEGKNWVYKGAGSCLWPDYDLCMVTLSDGGKDAALQREFNKKTKSFVEGGFVTRESKGSSSWLDKDTQIVGIDFGPGTMTESGYPMTARLWKRGQPLDSAIEFFKGVKTDVSAGAGAFERSDGSVEVFAYRSLTFYDYETYWIPRKNGAFQAPVKLPIPKKASTGAEFKGQMLLTLNEDWRGYKSGDLLSFSLDDFMKTGTIEKLNLVISPDERSSLAGYGVTKNKILMSVARDVKSAIYAYDWDGQKWTSKALDFPANGTVGVASSDEKETLSFISSTSFLSPSTLWAYDSKTGKKTKAKALPDWFDASQMVAEQQFATSKDGTKVPYFIVRSKKTKLDGKNPTLLYGYGGFEVSMTPGYSASLGKLWLEQGGVYVLSNIRGGGEYGPKWHQAGLKTKRQVIYDDFIAIAEKLIADKVTSPKHLGIEGGSNGGLLTGVMFTQRPDLFNAVICSVPLLDMMRFDKLLAGASWVGEYGSPADPVEGAFLKSISPYHNAKAGVKYPEIFFLTSTKDDRVHPGHARKMAKRLEDMGYNFLYYENIDGGHSAAANLKETARRLALQYTYLLQKLKDNQ
jgi:prolyl oligopeptidase